MDQQFWTELSEAKAADRRERAARSFPEKILALVRLQERHAAILKLRGKTYRVWKIEP